MSWLVEDVEGRVGTRKIRKQLRVLMRVFESNGGLNLLPDTIQSEESGYKIRYHKMPTVEYRAKKI
jgi:hypothetical protein